MCSSFSTIVIAPVVETYKITEAFNEDKSAQKINLDMLGTIRLDDNQPYVLPIVRKTEQLSDEVDFEYKDTKGDRMFSICSAKLMLGDELFDKLKQQNKIAFTQTAGATSALKVGGEFLRKHCGRKTVLLSKPTWGNHRNVFQQAGFTDIREFTYYDFENHVVSFDKMLVDLKTCPIGSIIVLHACCHNPSGKDLNKDQWVKLAELCKEMDFFPFFDACYLGLASGNVERDAWAIRYFVEKGHEILCAQSFAKIFTLYNERVGNLTLFLNSNNGSVQLNVERQLTVIVRSNYGCPNNHGASIVKTVLSDPAKKIEWENDLLNVYNRQCLLKQSLVESVKRNVRNVYFGQIDHIVNTAGMFAYLGLDEDSIRNLRNNCKIYMQKDGRINIFAINKNNLQYIAKSLAEEFASDVNKNIQVENYSLMSRI